eukprot:TRINITY_DN195_c0_g1_i2.p1 TRINITY_DN195_c0_g1~~TRINITY_DN195_c0_g1_i2.p1  ORF type:complete len:149 (-),score=22.74 TRINITY_DN195_c0_g1_i2:168-614(-)
MNQEILGKIFIAGIAFAALSCLARPDYNLVLYAFAYFIWDSPNTPDPPKQRIRLAYMFLYSSFIDFIWILFWFSYWKGTSYPKTAWDRGLHTFVLWLNVFALILKGVSIYIMYRTAREIAENMTASQIVKTGRDLFALGDERPKSVPF